MTQCGQPYPVSLCLSSCLAAGTALYDGHGLGIPDGGWGAPRQPRCTRWGAREGVLTRGVAHPYSWQVEAKGKWEAESKFPWAGHDGSVPGLRSCCWAGQGHRVPWGQVWADQVCTAGCDLQQLWPSLGPFPLSRLLRWFLGPEALTFLRSQCNWSGLEASGCVPGRHPWHLPERCGKGSQVLVQGHRVWPWSSDALNSDRMSQGDTQPRACWRGTCQWICPLRGTKSKRVGDPLPLSPHLSFPAGATLLTVCRCHGDPKSPCCHSTSYLPPRALPGLCEL